MLLPFSVRTGNHPTYFPERIIKCLVGEIKQDPGHKLKLFDFKPYIDSLESSGNWSWEAYGAKLGKKHTIRADEKKRWNAGRAVHPIINNRTKNQEQFAPTFSCKATQSFSIRWKRYMHGDRVPVIKIDKRKITATEIKLLAINDGFDDVLTFLAWFREDFKGKIIHWTDLKY